MVDDVEKGLPRRGALFAIAQRRVLDDARQADHQIRRAGGDANGGTRDKGRRGWCHQARDARRHQARPGQRRRLHWGQLTLRHVNRGWPLARKRSISFAV